MAGILEGIRVVDFTTAQVGPYAAAMLGDLGADVIHIEGPDLPDSARTVTTLLGLRIELPHSGSIFFEEHNRNKKCITLDVTKPKGLEIMHRLLEKSDIFISNFRARALKQLGLDYQTLSQHHPRLIYISSSGFGRLGSDADQGVLDLVAQARSGAMLATGEEDMPPVPLPTGMTDRTTAIFTGYAALAALLARERLGVVQEVHTSMLGSLMTLMGNCITASLFLGRSFPRWQRAKAINPLWNYYKCKDGRWIALGLAQSGRYWLELRNVLGCSALEDHKFDTMEGRAENREELVSLLDEIFASKTSGEWVPILKASEDIIFSVVNNVHDLQRDEQVTANHYIIDWNHPVFGPVKFMGFPWEFSKTPATLRSCAPAFGENTEEVLIELCGFSWEEIAELRNEGVV